MELTGLPGRPRWGMRLPEGPGNVPNARGLPGRMRTVQKPTWPSRSSTSLTTS